MEAKVEEFINLRQGNINMKDNSLKFIQLPKYAPYFMPNQRDEINRLLMRVFDLIE